MKAAVCIGVLHQNCLDSQRDGRKILISEDRLSHPKNREGFKVIAVINYVLYNLSYTSLIEDLRQDINIGFCI